MEQDNRSAGPSNHAPEKSTRPTHNRSTTWDLFSGIRKVEQEIDGFDSRNASQAYLQFADGDIPKNRAARFYNYLLNMSIVTRWFLFIVPVLGLLWIPGILGLTAYPDKHIWHVRLLWWSIWFSVVWGGWWAALAFSMWIPSVLRYTIGVVVVSLRKYIDWFHALQRYLALAVWGVATWVSFQPLILARYQSNIQGDGSDAFESSHNALVLISRLLFALMLSCVILLGEKFAIQVIAYKFHELSYAERIEEQKVKTKCLVVLYAHSRDVPGRADTLNDGIRSLTSNVVNPKKLLKNVLKGVRGAAETTTTGLGNVFSEMAGSSVLQPNSPAAMVATALSSANKTRLLARRIFYSFRQPGSDVLVITDIAHLFNNAEQAHVAFSLFDKDGNGDATRDEIEMACMDIHRERLALAASMKDVDSAVRHLDSICVTLYFCVAILIFAVALDAQVSSLLTGAGALLLGLSWLIGGTASEILTSIIFLFIKHPYDIGDCVQINKETLTVKEIYLLSTLFLDGRGALIQSSNAHLSTMDIINIRRSPQMSEPFEFDVAYDTTFEQIEALRATMLKFVESQRRDFIPIFDIVVLDIGDQEKMKLKADIKYKSNWQVGALKAQRRNKWICALKNALHQTQIWGPGGNPDSGPEEPKRITLVPYESLENQSSGDIKMPIPTHSHEGTTGSGRGVPKGDWAFSDKNAVILDDSRDVFGETEELHMPTPQGTLNTGVATATGRHYPPGAPSSSTSLAIRDRDGMTMDVSGGTSVRMRMPSGPSSSSQRQESVEEIEMSRPTKQTPS
jgi:hypothetical protein